MLERRLRVRRRSLYLGADLDLCACSVSPGCGIRSHCNGYRPGTPATGASSLLSLEQSSRAASAVDRAGVSAQSPPL